MQTYTAIAKDYITVWNEKDPAGRLELLAASWKPDATYADPLMNGSGLAEISGLIGAVQHRFPTFSFTLSGDADGFGDNLRFSWAFRPQDAAVAIKGADFIRREGDLIASVTGFLDQETNK
jgi:hypothetical protein